MDVQHYRPQYWLYQWIDEYAIRTVGDAAKVARKQSALDRLQELSDDASPRVSPELIPRYSVVAGSRADLSGELSCADYECIVPQVDYLFSRIWHYFDAVAIDAPSAEQFNNPMDDYVYGLIQRVRLLLHLRKIGAEQYIIFAPKPRGYCPVHFREHAEAENLDLLLDSELQEQVVEKLTSEAGIEIARREYGWHYSLRHPSLEEIIGTMHHAEASRRPTRDEVAREVFGRYCNALVADVSTSRSLGLPLLQSAEAPWLSYQATTPANSENIAALNMRLPILAGIPAAELLKIRMDNWPYFERLKNTLRSAIREQQNRAGSQSPEDVAAAVVEEIVNSELTEIEIQLRIAKENLGKKLATTAFITGIATTVGALPSVPLVIAAGVAAIGAATTSATVPQVFNYFDKRDKIKESNLYFLWKARVRAKH